VHRALLLLTTLALFAFGTPAQAASFDCAKARAPDEVAVCGNSVLSELDTEMSALWFAFSKVPVGMGSNGARRDEAEEFLKARSACGGDVACLQRIYQARVRTLKENIDRAMTNVAKEENMTAAQSAARLPSAVEVITAGYVRECRQLGGSLAGDAHPLTMTGDFDGDGLQDYVLNPQNLKCSAAATAFCGNGGCQIKIAVSGNGYQDPISVLGGQPTLSQGSEGTRVEIWVDGSHCNLSGREKACWASYGWKEGKVATTYQARALQP
jgi:uncharacterized protein